MRAAGIVTALVAAAIVLDPWVPIVSKRSAPTAQLDEYRRILHSMGDKTSESKSSSGDRYVVVRGISKRELGFAECRLEAWQAKQKLRPAASNVGAEACAL